MEYVYAGLLLHKLGKEINEELRSLSEHCIYREASNPKMVPEILPELYRKITM